MPKAIRRPIDDMRDLSDELREILGPTLELPPLSDAEAVRFIQELKAMPNPSPSALAWIKELEAAWFRAAEPDMRRR